MTNKKEKAKIVPYTRLSTPSVNTPNRQTKELEDFISSNLPITNNKKRNLGGALTRDQKETRAKNSITYAAPKKITINKNKKVRVACYIRISLLKEESVTFERQTMEMKSLALSEGIDLDTCDITFYQEEGGISAYKTKERPAFDKMIRDIVEFTGTDKSFTHVYAYELERITRNIELKNKIKPIFLDANCIIRLASMPSIRLDDSFADNILLDFLTAMAQQSSKSTAERQEGSQRLRASYGVYRGGTVPYGMVLEGNADIFRKHDKIMIPDENPNPLNPGKVSNANIIRSIFKLYIGGMSQTGIADKLNNDKVPTYYGAEKWSQSTIRSIILNPHYAGYSMYKHSELENGKKVHNLVKGEDGQLLEVNKPVISKEDYQKALDIKDGKRHTYTRSSTVYMLTGLLCCSDCGGRLVGGIRSKVQGPKYSCSNYQTKKASKSNSIKHNALENAIKHVVAGLLENKDILKNLSFDKADYNSAIANYKEEIAKLEVRLASEEDEEARALWTNKIRKLNAQIDAVEFNTKTTKAASDFKLSPNEFIKAWDNGEAELVYGVLTAIFDKIEISTTTKENILNDIQMKNKGWLANYDRITLVFPNGDRVAMSDM